MTKGQIESAVRRASNIFDKWNDVAGIFERDSGYYFEILGVIEDAVHCGSQAATRDFKKMDSEKDT